MHLSAQVIESPLRLFDPLVPLWTSGVLTGTNRIST